MAHAYDFNLQDADHFLNALDPSALGFTFAAFDELILPSGKKRKLHYLTLPCLHGSLHGHAGQLKQLNRQGAGIFVMVNAGDGKGRSDAHVAGIRAIWQDDDHGWQGAFPLKPSLVVQTSCSKSQRYWLVDSLSFDEHRAVMGRLTLSFGNDKGAKGLSRVLRLPGFNHMKREPFRVRLIEASGERYKRDEILGAFPPVKRQQISPTPWRPRSDDDDRVRQALFKIPADDRQTWLEVGMALKCHFGDAGRPLWDQWAAQSEKFDQRDQNKTWRSFRRKGIGIGTLFHHARRGNGAVYGA